LKEKRKKMNLLTSSVAFTPKAESGERFVEKYSFEQRKTQSAKIHAQYPDRVLVIVEPAPQRRRGGKNQKSIVAADGPDGLPGVIKSKFLVPGDQTVGRFLATFRKQLKLSKAQAIYLLTTDNTIPAVSMTMSQLNKQHQDEDGFLYLVYTGENTFGK